MAYMQLEEAERLGAKDVTDKKIEARKKFLDTAYKLKGKIKPVSRKPVKRRR